MNREPASYELDDVAKRTQWYVGVRLFLLLTIIVPGMLSLIALEGMSAQVRTDTALSIAAIASNLLFFGLTKVSRRVRYQHYLTAVWVMLDVGLISLIIGTNGGIESRLPILYTIPVLIAGALFNRRAIYITAIASAILYISIVGGELSGLVRPHGSFPALRQNIGYITVTVFFFPAVLLLIAVAVDFITTLLSTRQRQLRESLQALETAQEIAKLGSWEWDIARDEITWSKQLHTIYGLPQSKHPMTYAQYSKMLGPDSVATHRKTILQAMNDKVEFQVDHEIIRPDGSVGYVHGEGRPVLGRDGLVERMSGTAQDMTESYLLDSAKRDFVALASHQLRTPASGVKAFLSLLMDGHGGSLSPPAQNFAQQAYDANDRQLEIIDTLLNLAAIESGKMMIAREPLDLRSVLNQCIPIHYQKATQKRQRVKLVKSRHRLMVNADASALKMVVDNLLSNAIKYTPEAGRITITIRASSASAFIDVADTGIGIAKRDLPMLFGKFNRLTTPGSKTVGGSGLGLYIAKQIVDRHGGSITVRSVVGQGSVFTLRLPLFRRVR